MEWTKERILIVEDDLSLQPFWSLVLRRCLNEAQVDWTVSCERARVLVTEGRKDGRPYSMIITDIFLAGSDTGLDLLNSPEVQESRAMKLLVTAADEGEIYNHFDWPEHSIAVLAKPFSVPKCERVLEDMLRHRSVRQNVE